MDLKLVLVLFTLIFHRGDTKANTELSNTAIKVNDSRTEKDNFASNSTEVFIEESKSGGSVRLMEDGNSPIPTYAKAGETKERDSSPKNGRNLETKQRNDIKPGAFTERTGLLKPVFDHPRLRPREGQNVDFDDSGESDIHRQRTRSPAHEFPGRGHGKRRVGETNPGFHLTLGGYQLSPHNNRQHGPIDNNHRPPSKDSTDGDKHHKTAEETSNPLQTIAPQSLPNTPPQISSDSQAPQASSNGFSGGFYGFPSEVPNYNMASAGSFSSYPGFPHAAFQNSQASPVTDYSTSMFPGFNSNEVGGGYSPFDASNAYHQGNFPRTSQHTGNSFGYPTSFGQSFQQQPESNPGLAHYLMSLNRPTDSSTSTTQPSYHVPGSVSSPSFYDMNSQNMMQFVNPGQQPGYNNVPNGFPNQFAQYPGYAFGANTASPGPVTVIKEVEYTVAPERELQGSESESNRESSHTGQRVDGLATTTVSSEGPMFSRTSTNYPGFGERLISRNDTTVPSNTSTQQSPPFTPHNHQFYQNIPWIQSPGSPVIQPTYSFPRDAQSASIPSPYAPYAPNSMDSPTSVSNASDGKGFDTAEYFKRLHANNPYGQAETNAFPSNFFLNYPNAPDFLSGGGSPMPYGRPFLNENETQEKHGSPAFHSFLGSKPIRTNPKDFDGQQPLCSKKSGNATLCFEDEDYPREAIIYALETESLLLRRLIPSKMFQDSEESKEPENSEVKESNDDVCEASVKEGRPLRALNADGKWKILVNAAGRPGRRFFQKVRVETCKNTDDVCSHTVKSVTTKCVQKNNLVHLLCWEPSAGLHMDAFELPVACSCQVVKSPKVDE